MQTALPPSRDLSVANLHGAMCGSSKAHLQDSVLELAFSDLCFQLSAPETAVRARFTQRHKLT